MSELRWKDLRDGDFDSLKTVAEVWDGYVKDMSAQAEAITEDVVKKHLSEDHYESNTADDVRGQALLVADNWQDDLHEYAVVKIKATLEEAHAKLTTAQSEVKDLLEERIEGRYKVTGPADDHDLAIAEDLRTAIAELRPPADLLERAGVRDADLATGFGRTESISRLVEAAETEAADVAEVLRAIMTRAHHAEETAAGILRSIVDDPARQPPPLGATYDDLIGSYQDEAADRNVAFLRELAEGTSEASPHGVNQWWHELSDAERSELIENHPEVVGPVDGIPVADRDTANRAVLEDQIVSMDGSIAELEERIAAIESSGSLGHGPGSPEHLEYEELRAELESLSEDRKLLTDLDDRIAQPHGATGQEHFLLAFGTEGEGQAIVSVGNPDTADNVNVYVPGTGSELGGAGHDDGGLMNRVDLMAFDAHRLGPGQETATILWLGYDAPDNILPEARDPMFAQEATTDLSRFTDGLRATAEGDRSNLTMTGHSYGSTTVGTAARNEGLDVDNMIFIGSPGVGADSASELGTGSENVWASTNPLDIIQVASVHGENPTSDEFGGNTFTSEATRPIDDSVWGRMTGAAATADASVSNHSAYWDDENISRDNMAFIVTGQETQVK